MEIVRLKPPFWGIRHPHYVKQLVHAGHLVPGMRWSEPDHAWVGYPDAVEATALLLKDYGIKLDLSPLSVKRDWGEPIIPYATKSRRPYQLEGVRFLINQMRSGALLADWMGLGKTATTVTALRALNSKTVVVCPSYVRGVWQAETAKWWSKLHSDAVYLPATRTQSTIPPETKMVVIHYDILTSWLQALGEWAPRILVFDEGQNLAGGGTKRAEAAHALAAETPLRALLTGTPLANRPRDIFNVVETISPGRFGGDFFRFGQRYCNGHKTQIEMRSGETKTVWDFDGSSHEDELGRRLGWFMLRRTKQDVKLEIPPKQRQLVWVETKAKAKRFKPTERSGRVLRAALEAAADAKLQEGVDIALGDAQSGAKVVVYTWRRSVAEWVHRSAKMAGVDTELIHGGVAAMNRGKYIDRARTSPEGKGHVLAATIDSCATGIDLSFASIGVVLELTYEPHELLQMEARQDRFGQKNPVLFRYVLQRGSVDELIASTIIAKLGVFEQVVGATGDTLSKDLGGMPSEEDILKEIYAGVGT